MLANGTAKCWGYNDFGQLGNGTTTNSSTPVVVSGLTNAVAITAGGDHSCALLANGTAKCWGCNDRRAVGQRHHDQLVDAGRGERPHQRGRDHARAAPHSCALLANGTAKCWGDNSVGQLGNGTTTNSSTPVVVSGFGTKAVAITAGDGHSCALLANGTAKCWGDNSDGQLGNGTTTNSSTPVVVSGLTNAVAISGGQPPFVCVVGQRDRQMLGRQQRGPAG